MDYALCKGLVIDGSIESFSCVCSPDLGHSVGDWIASCRPWSLTVVGFPAFDAPFARGPSLLTEPAPMLVNIYIYISK